MIARHNVSRLDHQVELPLPTPEEPYGNSPPPVFLRPRSRAPEAAYRVSRQASTKDRASLCSRPSKRLDLHDHEDFCPINRVKVFMIMRTRIFVLNLGC
jgi:hypothetical protein